MENPELVKTEFQISGMSCSGCVSSVSKILEAVEGVDTVEILLDEKKAIIETATPPELKILKAAFANTGYGIHGLEEIIEEKERVKEGTKGHWYCPMLCEGDKIYSEFQACPVCGMDLIQKLTVQKQALKYHCPNHPEIIKSQQWTCVKCGEELMPFIEEPTPPPPAWKSLERKFWLAVAFSLPVFIIAMSDMIPGKPLLNILSRRSWDFIQFALSIPVVFYAARLVFERAYTSLKSLNFNMFTLIGIGSGIAWAFSVFSLLFPSLLPAAFTLAHGNVPLYFEAATVILTLVLLGQLLEAKAHERTGTAIKSLLKLSPMIAHKITGGHERTIFLSEVSVGDLLRVKSGEKIPVDGAITEGGATIDESMVSGESMPVEKTVGHNVIAGSINGPQSFVMQAQRVGSDTLLSRIIEMVGTASQSRAPIQRVADRIAGWFVPAVLGASILTFVIWAVFGPSPALAFALVNAIAVLIIACPCALGLATPMSIMVGMGRAAKSGILIRNAEALETLARLDSIVLDKTGTLTEGKPELQKTEILGDKTDSLILQYAASVNAGSEHPLAKAVLKAAEARNINLLPMSSITALAGNGVSGEYEGQSIQLVNQGYLKDHPKIKTNSELWEQGTSIHTKSYLIINNSVEAIFYFSDCLKADIGTTIEQLKEMGIDLHILSGDNAATVKEVATELGIASYQSSCLPEDKLNFVKKLKSEGKTVGMVGDGINDGPALALADVGIAMGNGTDVAIETAGLSILGGKPEPIITAIKLSKQVVKNIHQNLFFALFYNTLGIPLAAGILYPFLGILLSPMVAALAMSFSSVSVIGNALRLKRVKI